MRSQPLPPGEAGLPGPGEGGKSRQRRVESGEPEKIPLVEALTQNMLNFSFLRFRLAALSSPLFHPAASFGSPVH